ncbi:hypothetical protein NXC12_CH03298 [Rhizobium etli]|uniref:Uncharacterized protein n=1 Tax=Rhizobium etli TaxID=29449 RepID=A0AAN1BJ14_RHIET|nr:hypothetical protein REMIM1_CH03232 [Rhizobium etli bv. mimosae str. Mim1]ARQ11282.1 hypothetical protein NXC12_CH03298 [Rhizobium etli]
MLVGRRSPFSKSPGAQPCLLSLHAPVIALLGAPCPIKAFPQQLLAEFSTIRSAALVGDRRREASIDVWRERSRLPAIAVGNYRWPASYMLPGPLKQFAD